MSVGNVQDATARKTVCRSTVFKHVLLAWSMLAWLPGQAFGQDATDPTGLDPDRPWSIIFSPPNLTIHPVQFGGTVSLGLEKVLSARTNLLGMIGFNSLYGREKSSGDRFLDLTEDIDFVIGVKRYVGTLDRPAVPYLIALGSLTYRREEDSHFSSVDSAGTEITTSRKGAFIGIGADWFPLPELSIGGYTGFQFASEDRQFTVNVRSSRLFLNIYF